MAFSISSFDIRATVCEPETPRNDQDRSVVRKSVPAIVLSGGRQTAVFPRVYAVLIEKNSALPFHVQVHRCHVATLKGSLLFLRVNVPQTRHVIRLARPVATGYREQGVSTGPLKETSDAVADDLEIVNWILRRISTHAEILDGPLVVHEDFEETVDLGHVLREGLFACVVVDVRQRISCHQNVPRCHVFI